MRILMILDHDFPPDIRVENEIESLAENGHEVHVACYTQKGLSANEQLENCTVHRKPISKFIYKSSVGALKFPFYFNFWRSFLKELFSKYSFGAIHVHDLPMAQIGYEFAKKYKIPFTLDLHENWPALLSISTHTQTLAGRLLSSKNQWEKYEKNYCTKADNIVVVVEEAKERLVKMGIIESKIHVVSNTLNFKHFEVPTSKPDKEYTTLLYAGGITRHRGLQYVISGMKYLTDLKKPVRLWVLGTGSYLNELKQLAKEENIEDQVVFAGWKNYKEMQDYFGRADICLIPHNKSDHTNSTIPHKLFQYMYVGKPLVASNCDPIERIIKETNSGLIYRFDDPLEFAKKVKKIVNDKTLFKHIATAGKTPVINKYNWKIDSERLNEIYQ